jgi:hypothetical protein
MANTTDIGAIISNMDTLIEGLSPSFKPDIKFKRSPLNRTLIDWLEESNKSSAVFRRYEIERTGPSEEPELLDPSIIDRTEPLTLRIAYTSESRFYGPRGMHSLDDAVRDDARTIRDVIFSPDNYVSGQNAAFVTIEPIDKSFEGVWVQEFTILLRYWEAQSL